MKIKRILRLVALALLIAMASVFPVPITFFNRDKEPKYLTEQIDSKEDDEEKDDIKVLF